MYYKRSERRTVSYIKMLFRALIGMSLAILQIILYYIILVRTRNIPGVSILFFSLSLVCVSYIYNSKQNSSYKLTWTIVCFMFNLIGPIIFLIFGNGNNLPKNKNKKILSYLDRKMITTNSLEKLKLEDEIGYKHAVLLNHNTSGYPLYSNVKNTFMMMV